MMRASISPSAERGVALVITIMAVALLSALGLSLAMIVDTETRISGQFAGGREVLYAADAAIEIAAQELVGVGDWNLRAGGRSGVGIRRRRANRTAGARRTAG